MVTKIFQSGNSQAVRIPKQFQFKVKQVEILRRGSEIILRPQPDNLGRAFDLLTSVSGDFFAQGRNQPPNQTRKGL